MSGRSVEVEDLENSENPAKKDEKRETIRRDLARYTKISAKYGEILPRSSPKNPKICDLQLLTGKIDGSISSSFSDLRGGDSISDPTILVLENEISR